MMRPSLFRNYILLSIVITICMFFLGTSITRTLTFLRREKVAPPPNLTYFTARMMVDIDRQDPRRAFARVKEATKNDSLRRLWLVNEDGQILDSTTDDPLPVDWNQTRLPDRELDVQSSRMRGPPPPMMPPFMPGPPPGPPPSEIIRVSSNPAVYLLSDFRPRGNVGQEFMIMQLGLFSSIILASLLTFWLISRHVRSKASVAEQVMSQLQSGNLKARFPIQRDDEIGRIMALFNKMSDEIERLVEKNRQNERARMMIMQELAHDLRTPIASLKMTIETMIDGGDKMSKKISDELLSISLVEVNYFTRLVEDLLLLAQVLEPEYHAPHRDIEWVELLDDEVESVQARMKAQNAGKEISISWEPGVREMSLRGDRLLLHRAFKNVIQNALTFARSAVHVVVQKSNEGGVQIVVRDDGVGFEEGMLATYGDRRFSRFLSPQRNGHLSVGLGAVIVKKVMQLHAGQLEARNHIGPDGKTAGAEVRMTLPASA